MRNYNIITFDSTRNDLATVLDYESGDFNITKLWRSGKIINGSLDNLLLYVDENNIDLTDIVGNPLSLLIFSKRLLDICLTLIKKDVQVFEHPLYRRSNTEIKGFSIVHPYKEFECVDIDKSELSFSPDNEMSIVGQLHLKNASIPDDIHIFRVKEDNNTIVVSDELANLLVGKGFNGIAFIRCYSHSCFSGLKIAKHE